jgi:nucleoside-diphosphate-sugar epimerase
VIGPGTLKVLVTGGTGFIGHHLCRRLCDEGHDVHATSRRQVPSDGRGPTWHQADMADPAAAHHIIGSFKPDIVFHLAGAVGASPERTLLIPTFQSLLTSTINVLMAATDVGCGRIVLIGSQTEPILGEGAATPRAPYAAAKWAASGYGRMFHMLYQTPVVILRPFMAYGPGQAANKLVPSVILSLLRGESPKLSHGDYKSDRVYIADAIDGFVAAMSAPAIEGKTIDLGSGSLISMRDVAVRLTRIVGSDVMPTFGTLPDRPGENAVVADIELASTLLGWRATTSLDNGLRQTVEWYKEGRN